MQRKQFCVFSVILKVECYFVKNKIIIMSANDFMFIWYMLGAIVQVQLLIPNFV